MARASGDDAWLTVRPPIVPLSAAEAQSLFEALDGTGFRLAA